MKGCLRNPSPLRTSGEGGPAAKHGAPVAAEGSRAGRQGGLEGWRARLMVPDPGGVSRSGFGECGQR